MKASINIGNIKESIMNSNGIFANNINIGENVEISPQSKIICDNLFIGDGTVIKGKTQIVCKDCIIGKNNFIVNTHIEGSLNAGRTRFEIGNENLILQNSHLNCNEKILIGNDVNIGQKVSIWTHASSMNVFDGYPFTKAPVNIGSHVWITEGTTILPGVDIGSHIIIGNSSVVNKNLPNGCFAAGVPARIIHSNAYPIILSHHEKNEILIDCIKEYNQLLKLKPFNAELRLLENLSIEFIVEKTTIIFDVVKKEINGEITEFSEDFRDFLRYRGIKFFSGEPFHSITPIWCANALNNNTII